MHVMCTIIESEFVMLTGESCYYHMSLYEVYVQVVIICISATSHVRIHIRYCKSFTVSESEIKSKVHMIKSISP